VLLIKVDLVEQGIPKLSYIDPSDAHGTNLKRKYANLVLHLDTIVVENANEIRQLNKDSFYRKALSAKIDYENLSVPTCYYTAYLKTNNLTS
jgi:hypothetical protein